MLDRDQNAGRGRIRGRIRPCRGLGGWFAWIFPFFLEMFLDILSFCWDIPHLTPAQVHLADGIHVIEFEHGTTSGSRVLRVDREVTSFENWETFRIN